MQLQLSLKIADRLHHDLLVRGGPLGAHEAARMLLGAAATPALSLQVLEVLIRDDQRFCWDGPAGGLLGLRSWGFVDPDLLDVPFVALDLETTGAKAGAGKITEVGAVRIERLSIVDHFHTLVNPQRSIPPMITWITGITEEMVADAPRIEEVIPSLLDFLEGAVVVAHNAPFDVGFLNYELHRLRSRRLGEGAVDTLPLSRTLVPGLANYRLKTVADALSAPVAACHRALADAQAVAHVFIHLAGVLQDRGVATLSAAREHGRPTSPSHLEKLALTKDLPTGPGTFVFLGEEERALLVGRADHLADDVRSFFMAGARRHKGLRTAVRLVERIDHEQTATTLEAVVREQQLLLEHRPPYNQYWTAPEGYVYIKAGARGPGLNLLATRRAPRWLGDPSHDPLPPQGDLVIGPFRRRGAAYAAVSLLRECYPIRHCPRRPETRPCGRGSKGQCLSPCMDGAEACARHDALVTDLVRWLAGCDLGERIDPLHRAEEVALGLSRQGLHEQAGQIREGRDHLVAVRHWYDVLAKARELCFACLWLQDHAQSTQSVRVNLVWRGRLVSCSSLTRHTLEAGLSEMLETLSKSTPLGPARTHLTLVSVPQAHLDPLLAVGRWFQEGDQRGAALVPLQIPSADALPRTRAELASAARALLQQ